MSSEHPLVRIEEILLIAAGGALGANGRYAIGLVFPDLRGTFVANVVGSYLLGFLLYEAMYTDLLAERTRVVFGTGFLSSFTTYSTFALESVQAPLLFGVVNVVGSYAVGFTAVVVGGKSAALLVAEAASEGEGTEQ